MKIFSTIKIGNFHTNFCEDFLFSTILDETYVVGAVMDGCSSGTDSQFASALLGKIIQNVSRQLDYKLFHSKEEIAVEALVKEVVKGLFEGVQYLKNYLLLETHELLSTVVLAIYNKQSKEAFIICIGDGVVAINGDIHSFHQNDKPDYLAYHLDETFEEWFTKQRQILHVQKVLDLSISTDGIQSFDSNHKKDTPDALHFLLVDSQFANTEEMLHKKCIILERDFGLTPNDDLSIIRLIN